MKTIAFLGRTNAGKSTLLNALINNKIAAVSNKVHTTRIPLSSVFSHQKSKWLFLDAPGLCRPLSVLDQIMFQNLKNVLETSDLIWLVVDVKVYRGTDIKILIDLLKKQSKPTILVINKTDLITSEQLIKQIPEWNSIYPFNAVVPISAKKKYNFKNLISATAENLSKIKKNPKQVARFSFLEITKEIIREQIIHQTNDELPHQTALILKQKRKRLSGYTFFWNILVTSSSQKSILLGKHGSKIESIRKASESKLSKIWKKNVRLSFYIVVEPKWFQKKEIIKKLNIEW